MNTLTINDLTKDQKSLLLYLESRAVDHGGAILPHNMNQADWENLEAWVESGFVASGRIASEDITERRGAHWVKLSSEAIALAHELREDRIYRQWENRTWRTTEEKRAL